MIKRLFDIWLSSLVLVVLSPVIFTVASFIAVFMGTPVIFSQLRPGFKGKPFTMYKFRSMKEAFDSEGKPLPDAERMTNLGKFLRASSLDELPGLLNVLKGEMSLVGPRPLRVDYLALYSKEQNKRHDVLPGITGWAQVNGRNAISWPERFKLDLWYIENHSFWLDLKILFLTILRVVKPTGINATGHVSMPDFKGEQ